MILARRANAVQSVFSEREARARLGNRFLLKIGLYGLMRLQAENVGYKENEINPSYMHAVTDPSDSGGRLARAAAHEHRLEEH